MRTEHVIYYTMCHIFVSLFYLSMIHKLSFSRPYKLISQRTLFIEHRQTLDNNNAITNEYFFSLIAIRAISSDGASCESM